MYIKKVITFIISVVLSFVPLFASDELPCDFFMYGYEFGGCDYWNPPPLPDDAGDTDWFGVFRKGSSFEIKRVRLIINESFPPGCEQVLQRVKVDSVNDPLFLVRGPKEFRTGETSVYFQGKRYFHPGENYGLWTSSDEYYLIFYANVVKGGTSPSIRDYKMGLRHTLRQPKGQIMRKRHEEQIVFHFDYINYNAVHIEWIGDFDKDNVPDILMSIYQDHGLKYNLYLSSFSQEGEMVKLVGDFYYSTD